MTFFSAFLLAVTLNTSSASGAVVTAPPPVEPQPRTRVGLAMDVLWPRDRGHDVFSGDSSSTAVGIAAAYDITRIRRCVLSGGAGWQSGKSHGYVGDTTDTALSVNAFHVSAAGRLRLFKWLDPQARVTAGASRAHASINPAGAPELVGSAWSGFARAGLGLALLNPQGWFSGDPQRPDKVRILVDIESGWMLSTAFDLALRPTGLPKNAIGRSAVSLGDLNQSGPYLRVMVGLVF